MATEEAGTWLASLFFASATVLRDQLPVVTRAQPEHEGLLDLLGADNVDHAPGMPSPGGGEPRGTAADLA